jgi:uncharacterized protein (TIGR03083 family)
MSISDEGGSLAGPVEIVPTLRAERAVLLELLQSLNEEQWSLPTECPKWSIKGIALHLLCDDLSLLSRQRDGQQSGLVGFAQTHPGLSFLELLDGFNEAFVDGARFLSRDLLLELLKSTGDHSADFYAAKAPDELGEPVFWLTAVGAFPAPAPYWAIALREYNERFIHHHQIARALGVPGPREDAFLIPAFHGFMRLIAARFVVNDEATNNLAKDVRIHFAIDGTDHDGWTIESGESWVLHNGKLDAVTTTMLIARDTAARLITKALTSNEITQSLTVSGNKDLGALTTDFLASFFARPMS